MDVADLETLRRVLADHEITHIDFYLSQAIGHNRRGDGFWVPIAYCKCGFTSPPEHRASHLTSAVRQEPA